MGIEDLISEEMDIFIAELIESYDRLGMRASGDWAESLEKRVGPDFAIIFGEDYTEYLTKGRPPNVDQSPEGIRRWAVGAGLSFIKEWAEAKGVDANPIAIAYKIAREGTSWHPRGSDLLEAVFTDENIAKSATRLGQRLEGMISDLLTRELQRA